MAKKVALKVSKSTKTAKPAAAKASKAKPATKAAAKPPAKTVAKPAAKPIAKPLKAVAKVLEKPKAVAKAPVKAIKAEKPAKVIAAKPIEKNAVAQQPVAVQMAKVLEIRPQEKAPKPPKAAKAPKVPKVKVARMTKAKLAAEKSQVDDLKKWSDYKDKFGDDKAQSYAMSATYEARTAILHKVLGWGFIIQVQNDRLEVLFESGSKVLISNYKS